MPASLSFLVFLLSWTTFFTTFLNYRFIVLKAVSLLAQEQRLLDIIGLLLKNLDHIMIDQSADDNEEKPDQFQQIELQVRLLKLVVIILLADSHSEEETERPYNDSPADIGQRSRNRIDNLRDRNRNGHRDANRKKQPDNIHQQSRIPRNLIDKDRQALNIVLTIIEHTFRLDRPDIGTGNKIEHKDNQRDPKQTVQTFEVDHFQRMDCILVEE